MSAIAEVMPNVATTLIDNLISSNRGDHHAFSYNARRYSYQDVAALMNRAGNMLKALGVEAGTPILLLLPPSPALVASLLGAIKAGAVPVLGAPGDSSVLERCVASVGPSAAIVHESRLADARGALAAIPHDSVVVAGADAQGYRSFVEEMRGQPSWLAAQDVGGNAPALAVWTGSALERTTHAELAAFLKGAGELRATSGHGLDAELSGVGAMLRAFSRGEEATLV